MTDAVVNGLPRGDHARSTARCVAAVNRRLEIVRRLHEHKVANGIPLRDPGREDAMIARLVARRTPGRSRTRASPSFFRFVLDLTRRGAPWRLAASSACPATGSGPR